MIATGAMAADVPPLVVAAPPPPPMAAPAFDWDGLYVGVGAGTDVPFLPAEYFGAQVGGTVGYNFVAGQFVAGVEGGLLVGVGNWAGAPLFYYSNVRAGVLLGEKLLAYGFIGIHGDLDGYRGWHFGGGLELALGNSWSVFADLSRGRELGCMDCGFNDWFSNIGIRWHLGN